MGFYGKLKTGYQVPVTPKMTYNLSADLKLGANTISEFKVSWFKSDDTLISTDSRLSYSTSGGYGTDWHHKSTRIQAPTDAAKAEIQLWVDGIGEAWFDNLMFEGGTGRSGNNLIANAGFDVDIDSDESHMPDVWEKPSSSTTGITIDYNMKKDGLASARIEGDNSQYKYVVQKFPLAGKKGTKFNLSGWGKQSNISSSGGGWLIQLKFIPADGSPAEYRGIFFDRNQAEWQQVSRLIEAPKDFVQVGVYMSLNGMPVGAKAWFDDIKVNQVDVDSSSISVYNYLDNSSFEYDYEPNNWPDGWYSSNGNNNMNLTATWEDMKTKSTQVYTGTHSIKITNPASYESVTRSNDKVPYDSSKTYSAVGYIKTENVNSSAVLLVYAYNSAGTWLGEIPSQTVTGTKDWTRVSIVINSSNVPAGTTQLAVGVQMRAGTGTSYFDNIRLQEGDFRTQFGYDAGGNYVTTITNPFGQNITLTPDPNTGNITSLKDALNNLYSYEYNMKNQITKFTFPYQGALGQAPVNKSYSYSYDKNAHLTAESRSFSSGKLIIVDNSLRAVILFWIW